MNDELIGVDELMADDGYVNFYSLLAVERTATPEAIIDSINALYQEAQTNRDHRVSARRREYGLLLEILPQARTILTDKSRRKRYDAYCNAVEMQLPRMPYTDFFNDLMREKEAVDARSDILTVRDLSRLRSISPEGASSDGTAIKSVATAKPQPINEVVAEKEVITTPSTTSHSQEEIVSPPVATSEQKLTKVSTPAPTTSSPIQALVGGGIVFLGMLASLPAYAAIPIVLATPLSLICAGVTAYVFSMTNEPSEA
jgi:hypothetical protein